VFKGFFLVVAAGVLAACGAPKPREPATYGAPFPTTGPPSGPGIYAIDPAQSEIRLLVYRAGAMARLGHNHVITHHAVGGWIKFSGDPTGASFALTLPVADFVVDNPGARAQEGSDFFEEVTEDAKQGTQHNMLSPALLDAEKYPAITLTSVSVTGKADGMVATMTVRIAGHEATLVAPFRVATATGQISAAGVVNVQQSALGLKPFSIMLGALQVQDDVTVKFRLYATR
jgi:hypothetical protein